MGELSRHCCAVSVALQSGLHRLEEAAATIDELSQQAQHQRALLAQKQDEADRALADIQVGKLALSYTQHLIASTVVQLGLSTEVMSCFVNRWCSESITQNKASAPVELCCQSKLSQILLLLLQHALQTSMEVAADRKREVEVLRQQLADSELVLQEQRGKLCARSNWHRNPKCWQMRDSMIS